MEWIHYSGHFKILVAQMGPYLNVPAAPAIVIASIMLQTVVYRDRHYPTYNMLISLLCGMVFKLPSEFLGICLLEGTKLDNVLQFITQVVPSHRTSVQESISTLACSFPWHYHVLPLTTPCPTMPRFTQ